MKKEDKVSPIKELRERIGVSQRQFADALGVHHSYIANLESNLINIEEEDEEGKSKVKAIFEKIAEWSGEDAEELIKKQNNATSESLEKIKAQVKEQLSDVAENLGGSRCLSGHEADFLLNELKTKSSMECKSPITIIRELGGITQRHLAQAADVSQAYIARIERGELTITGPNTGLKLFNCIVDGFGGQNLDDYSEEALYDLFDIQEEFIKCNKERAKDMVKSAFKRIKKGKGSEKE